MNIFCIFFAELNRGATAPTFYMPDFEHISSTHSSQLNSDENRAILAQEKTITQNLILGDFFVLYLLIVVVFCLVLFAIMNPTKNKLNRVGFLRPIPE